MDINIDTYSVIKGTGSYLPENKVANDFFLKSSFYDKKGRKINKPTEETIKRLFNISGIEERRYISEDQATSDIAYLAAMDAINSSHIDMESIDRIIVSHDFGDIRGKYASYVPSIASRVKNMMEIKNPYCVASDTIFGCPGWNHGVIQADCFIKSRNAKRVLVIGVEALSMVADPHDVDSMLYSDGAGAVIMDAYQSEVPVGVLSSVERSDTLDHAYLLWQGESNKPGIGGNFLKMDGHKVFNYATIERVYFGDERMPRVPGVTKQCLDKAGLSISDVNKILIHQANEKMDIIIFEKLFELYDIKVKKMPADERDEILSRLLPITIKNYGNNSTATIPIMLDHILKGKVDGHNLDSGDIAVFASVGAGMNINAIVYKMH